LKEQYISHLWLELQKTVMSLLFPQRQSKTSKEDDIAVKYLQRWPPSIFIIINLKAHAIYKNLVILIHLEILILSRNDMWLQLWWSQTSENYRLPACQGDHVQVQPSSSSIVLISRSKASFFPRREKQVFPILTAKLT